jgi:hypothetical protein
MYDLVMLEIIYCLASSAIEIMVIEILKYALFVKILFLECKTTQRLRENLYLILI